MIHFLLSLVMLFVGTMIIAFVYTLVAGREDFKVFEGVWVAIIAMIVGSGLFWFWGWWATFGVLMVLMTWVLVGGFLERSRKPESEPQHRVGSDASKGE